MGRNKWIVLKIFWILLLSVVQIYPSWSTPEMKSIDLFVSTKGQDNWSGLLRNPNSIGNDGPLASIDGALQKIHQLSSSMPDLEKVQIWIRKGTYLLAKPIEIKSTDIDTNRLKITIAAYPGENPILSGARCLTGWKPSPHGKKIGRTVWELELPEVKNGKWYFKELFTSNQRLLRTRLPESGLYRFAGVIDEGEPGPWHVGNQAMTFHEGDIQNWKNLSDVEIVGLVLWIETRLPIAMVDEASRTVQFAKKSTFRLTDNMGGPIPCPYYVENVFEALRKPGQWYLDRTAGKIFYIPRSLDHLATFKAYAPSMTRTLSVVGTDSQKIRNLIFKGLTFRHVEWDYPADDAGSAQAAFEVPAAIHLEHAIDCAFEDCTVEQVGTYGIEVGSGCENIGISYCTLQDLGAGGIKIDHGTSRTTVSDCQIRNGGRIYHSGVGIWVGNSGQNTLIHNDIYDFYYTGISIGWTWGYAPTLTHDNLVEYNHIHQIGQGLLSDMGGIYHLGTDPGTRLAHNLIHDVSSATYGGWGIYTDEGSSQVLIENNLVYHTKTGGFHQHYGRENIVRNNIFALAKIHQIQRSREEEHKSFDFVNNIVYFLEGELLGNTWKNDNFVMDRNIYWNPNQQDFKFSEGTFEEWKSRGHDLNSQITDPLFVDVAANNFSLKPNSPAIEMGFIPIDLRTVGPRPRYKK